MNICPLTGLRMDPSESKIYPITDMTYTYEFLLVGKVKIALPTYQNFINSKQFKHPILAGICRESFENKTEPPLINTDFLENGIKNINYPKTFIEKNLQLLKFMYKNKGNDYADFHFNSIRDYPLVYATGEEEFNKIIDHLEGKNFIKIGNRQGMAGHRIVYQKVTLTDYGIEEIEKGLPKIPMIGLVNQEIFTGDIGIDSTINHAKQLFFEQPITLDKMPSACESLSYVLEPLRIECEKLFAKRDINDFFKIVNEFDIRHNKHSTKQIKYPEQLEWIFYSLLNTINTYTKLKKKEGN
jgi:hypothetical protein